MIITQGKSRIPVPAPFSKVLFWLSFLGNKKIVSYKIIPSKNTQLFWKVRKQQKNGFYEIALELSEKSRNEIFNALTGTLKFSFLIFLVHSEAKNSISNINLAVSSNMSTKKFLN